MLGAVVGCVVGVETGWVVVGCVELDGWVVAGGFGAAELLLAPHAERTSATDPMSRPTLVVRRRLDEYVIIDTFT